VIVSVSPCAHATEGNTTIRLYDDHDPYGKNSHDSHFFSVAKNKPLRLNTSCDDHRILGISACEELNFRHSLESPSLIDLG
jgi:hypothetical protein